MDDRQEQSPDDAEVTALLQRVRPVGPSDALRARVVSGTRPQLSAWRWALAAAALLALAVGLPAWSARLVASAMPAPAADDSVQALADLLGWDERAEQTASLMVMIERIRAEQEARHANGHARPVQP